jgi:hypothetical protein
MQLLFETFRLFTKYTAKFMKNCDINITACLKFKLLNNYSTIISFWHTIMFIFISPWFAGMLSKS